MTVRADEFHHNNVPAHSTALALALPSAPLQHRFSSLRPLAFPKVKIVFEREESFDCDDSA